MAGLGEDGGRDWLVAGGELGDLLRATDWGRTPFGPRAGWPQSLRTALGLVVESRLPMALLWGPDLLLLYNDAYRELAGSRHPSALGRPTREVWSEVWHLHRPLFAEVLDRGHSLVFQDMPFPLHRLGRVEEAFFTLCYSPVRCEDGSIAGVLVTLQETTDSVRAARALQDLKGVLEEGQHLAHVGTFEYQVDTQETTWSEEEYHIYGLDPHRPSPTYEELLARCVHPEDVSRLREAFSAALVAGSVFDHCHRLIRPDGSVRWVRNRAQPHFDEQGRPVRYVGVTLDITEAEQAQEALRAADRHKDEFLATLAHELRNPLAAIRTSLHLLERAPAGSEPWRTAETIIGRQVAHLARLVDDLLDVARIARGKVILQREPLDLLELVRRTVEDHRPAFEASGVALELVTTGEAWVEGDPVRLAQVLGNLLQNAMKYTPEGGKTTVEVLEEVARQRVVLRVRDTGRGFPTEFLPRLFEPFVQAEATLDRRVGGLGLGLALVKGIVTLHGGTVSASSAGPGAGATFTVELPARSRPPASAPAADEEHPRPSPRKVLVVEDNRDAAESLRAALELAGHQVETAASGPEGLLRASAFRPDVVLCDIGLPGLDGYGVARALRADPELSGATLLALSGYARREDVERSLQAGFDAHLAKPPDLAELARRIDGHGEGSGDRADPRGS